MCACLQRANATTTRLFLSVATFYLAFHREHILKWNVCSYVRLERDVKEREQKGSSREKQISFYVRLVLFIWSLETHDGNREGRTFVCMCVCVCNIGWSPNYGHNFHRCISTSHKKEYVGSMRREQPDVFSSAFKLLLTKSYTGRHTIAVITTCYRGYLETFNLNARTNAYDTKIVDRGSSWRSSLLKLVSGEISRADFRIRVSRLNYNYKYYVTSIRFVLGQM